MISKSHVLTNTNPAACEWTIHDGVTSLRGWATGKTCDLPTPPHEECIIGTDPACAIRLDDPAGMVSRLHAHVVREPIGWRLRDLQSKNGLWIDGAQRDEIVLQPGIEIGIGGLTFIADSPLLTKLRGFLARLLGWSADSDRVLDQALRSVRFAATSRAPLVLTGAGDLVSIAHAIHRRTRGEDRPFILCDPRRQRERETVRSVRAYSSGKAALAAAIGGSLCVRSRWLPSDFDVVVAAARRPGAQVQLVVCTDAPDGCKRYHVEPIVIPPLASRAAELDRIIDEYFEDALRELAVPRPVVMPDDRAWVRQHASRSLPEIEKATLRLLALRTSRSLTSAAGRLGMAPISLSRWIGRRHLPPE